jgi:SAM-dependent methyltransferase
VDQRSDRLASSANLAAYDAHATREYVDGAPHIKHAALRRLFRSFVAETMHRASEWTSHPRVLDLGAGEGSTTIPFLELGAVVTAVDQSESQLASLHASAAPYSDRLIIRCADVWEALGTLEPIYDVIVVSSFLHHVPDYLTLIGQAIPLMGSRGVFLSFQDPLRYDTLDRLTSAFGFVAYASWRVFKGDLVGGVWRRVRRTRGIYLDDSPHDNAEYHVTRNGVDHEAIMALLQSHGFDCRLVRYFSTQNRVFQRLGARLKLENTFGVIAQCLAESG